MQVGFGKVIGYVFGLGSPYIGIAISGITVWAYTVAGGILSVAYTDIFQVCNLPRSRPLASDLDRSGSLPFLT